MTTPPSRRVPTATRRQVLGYGLATLALAACSAPRAEVTVYDLAVYGGTPAGIMAAIAAARQKLKVVLILGESPLGGMVTNGLGRTDITKPEILGGWTKDFFTKVGEAYGRSEPVFRFEPSVALATFQSMLSEADVPVMSGLLAGASVSDGAVSSLRLTDGSSIVARTYVDASYEGDLLFRAGIAYRTGRESSAEFGESFAGYGLIRKTVYDSSSPSLFPADFLTSVPTTALGAADGKTMSYNYRLCLTTDLARGTPFPRPDGYDADAYHAALPYLAQKGTINAGELENSKFDLNNGGSLTTDLVNGSWLYPLTTTAAQRAQIAVQHTQWMQGLLYHLTNDSRVKPEMADDVRRYALAADEFTDNGNWPKQLYVRVSRRVKGRMVMTQRDVLDPSDRDDAVAYGAYQLDSHLVQRFRKPDGSLTREGGITYPKEIPKYAIPLDAIRPATGGRNVLSPVCLSASHVASASLRMEPHYMLLGEAAGAAAAVASQHKTVVSEVTPDEVRSALKSKDSVLSAPW